MFIIYGTPYLGKKNLRKHVGVCGHCGQTGELADYEARQWFTLYFIPIIPLGRKQVLDYCGRCRHCRMVGIGQADLYRQPEMQGGSDESLALAAIENGDLARARHLLGYMDRPDARYNPTAMLALAAAHQQNQQHAEALQAARIALANAPHLAWNREFRRMVKASEDATFAGESMLPRRPLWKSKPLLVGAAVAALVAILLAASSYIASHRPVHVVNGLPRPVTLSIDGGRTWTIAPGQRQLLRLAEGTHRAAATAGDDLRDDFQFTIPRGAFLGRLVDHPTYIVNPFGAAPVNYTREVYSSKDRPRPSDKGETALHVGKRFLAFNGIHYLFQEFPKEIQTKETQPQCRTQVTVLAIPPAVIVAHLAQEGTARAEDVLQYAEVHLRAHPEDNLLIWAYAGAAQEHRQLDRCRKFLATGVARRPVRMTWHRCLQGLRELAGEGEQLLDEYGRMLQAEPDSADLAYLCSRLQQRCSGALGYTQKARRLDPNNPYPLLGETFHRMALGQFPEAKAAATELNRLAPEAPEFGHAICQALWAAGELKTLEERYRALRAEEPASIFIQQSLLDVLTAKGDEAGVKAAQEEYSRHVERAVPGDPGQLILRSRLYLNLIRGRYEAVLAEAPQLADAAEQARHIFWACCALGRTSEAERQLPRLPALSWHEQCILSIAMHAAGEAQAAAAWRQKATEKLAQGDGNDRAGGALLARGGAADPDAALDLPMEAPRKAAVLVALIQAGADRKLLALAVKLNCFPGPAKTVLDRAIGNLKTP